MNIKDFAYKKQAPIDSATNAVINGVVTWFMLSGVSTVAIISGPGDSFSLSLMGSLAMPAVMIAFIISLLTTRATVKKRISGELTPELEAGVSWIPSALKWGFIRAIINIIIIYGIGGIITQFNPDLQISRIWAAILVAMIAAIIAYIESVYAVLRTSDLNK